MNVGVAHSEVNPNTQVMNSRGIWLAYLLLVTVLYLFLHTVKGTPFETPDQGKACLLTHWEQMDNGIQFTSSPSHTLYCIFLPVSTPSTMPRISWSIQALSSVSSFQSCPCSMEYEYLGSISTDTTG